MVIGFLLTSLSIGARAQSGRLEKATRRVEDFGLEEGKVPISERQLRSIAEEENIPFSILQRNIRTLEIQEPGRVPSKKQSFIARTISLPGGGTQTVTAGGKVTERGSSGKVVRRFSVSPIGTGVKEFLTKPKEMVVQTRQERTSLQSQSGLTKPPTDLGMTIVPKPLQKTGLDQFLRPEFQSTSPIRIQPARQKLATTGPLRSTVKDKDLSFIQREILSPKITTRGLQEKATRFRPTQERQVALFKEKSKLPPILSPQGHLIRQAKTVEFFREVGSNIIRLKPFKKIPISERFKGTKIGSFAQQAATPAFIFAAPAVIAGGVGLGGIGIRAAVPVVTAGATRLGAGIVASPFVTRLASSRAGAFAVKAASTRAGKFVGVSSLGFAGGLTAAPIIGSFTEKSFGIGRLRESQAFLGTGQAERLLKVGFREERARRGELGLVRGIISDVSLLAGSEKAFKKGIRKELTKFDIPKSEVDFRVKSLIGKRRALGARELAEFVTIETAGELTGTSLFIGTAKRLAAKKTTLRAGRSGLKAGFEGFKAIAVPGAIEAGIGIFRQQRIRREDLNIRNIAIGGTAGAIFAGTLGAGTVSLVGARAAGIRGAKTTSKAIGFVGQAVDFPFELLGDIAGAKIRKSTGRLIGKKLDEPVVSVVGKGRKALVTFGIKKGTRKFPRRFPGRIVKTGPTSTLSNVLGRSDGRTTFVPSRVGIPSRSFVDVPSRIPSFVPTKTFTDVPSRVPTILPSDVPSIIPTDVPSIVPTIIPTKVPPIDVPTNVPVIVPSDIPSKVPPIDVPSKVPTDVPTETIVSVPSPQPRFPPFPPLFSLGGGPGPGFGFGRRRKGRRTRFTSSIAASILGITARKAPKSRLFTGLEIRPIITGRSPGSPRRITTGKRKRKRVVVKRRIIKRRKKKRR